MPRIVRSEITKQGVEVEWSDDIVYTFDINNEFVNLSKPWVSFIQPKDRLAVSATSARLACVGCGIRK